MASIARDSFSALLAPRVDLGESLGALRGNVREPIGSLLCDVRDRTLERLNLYSRLICHYKVTP